MEAPWARCRYDSIASARKSESIFGKHYATIQGARAYFVRPSGRTSLYRIGPKIGIDFRKARCDDSRC
ncbi:MAG: hypothetical protein E5Y86_20065 [Mesorhizobium sp.]|nr:MAG: hypothetical protein E5Y86_20065 [Mesorhizobium sp.]